MSRVGGFMGFLDDVTEVWEKSSSSNFFVFDAKKLGTIRIFRALNWVSTVSGWQIMAKKRKSIS